MEQLTQSEENYIKAIFAIQERTKKSVGTNDLAERMDTKASSVTDMVKRLSDKAFIQYEKYKGCRLTEEGSRIALKTIRKHRLWETFLVEKLNFGWEEVHEVAEQLEHIQSVKLTNQLDRFLEYPKFDPHGDPIPDQNGDYTTHEKSVQLSILKKDIEAIIVGVSDSSGSFLKYLDKHNIQIGSTIKVNEHFEFDDSLEVVLNGKILNLSAVASTKIRTQVQD